MLSDLLLAWHQKGPLSLCGPCLLSNPREPLPYHVGFYSAVPLPTCHSLTHLYSSLWALKTDIIGLKGPRLSQPCQGHSLAQRLKALPAPVPLCFQPSDSPSSQTFPSPPLSFISPLPRFQGPNLCFSDCQEKTPNLRYFLHRAI